MASFPNCRRFSPRFDKSRARVPITWWREATRLIMAGLWVLSLTLFSFFQYVYLAGSAVESESADALLAAAVISRGLPHNWWMSFLPSLAFGIAWLGLSRLSWRPGLGLLDRKERILRVRIISTFSVALLGWILFYKIWIIIPFIGADWGIASPELLTVYLKSHANETSGVLGKLLFRFHGATALLVVFVESRQQMKSLYRRFARTTSMFTVSLLAVAILIPAADLYSWVRTPVALDVLEFRGWPKALKAAIKGGELSEVDWRFYSLSRDSEAEWVSPPRLGRDNSEVCATARLPLSPLFTWAIPVALSDEPPVDTTPRIALEIPASGRLVRMYGPTGEQQEIPIDSLGDTHFEADWVIFKADMLLEIETIREHLETLRRLGVRRISAVVRPVGWGSPPGEAVRLKWGGDTTAPLFELKHVPDRRVVYVSRWVPPGPVAPPQCDPVDGYYGHRSLLRLLLPTQGTVPAQVSLSDKGTWQDLLTRLSVASTGGARSVQVLVAEQ